MNIEPKNLLLAVLFAAVLSCTDAGRDQRPLLTVWMHAGRAAERETMTEQVKRFNEMEKRFRVDLTFIPEGSYNGQVQAAAVAGDLPDLLEFDGPYVYSYVWQKILVPLEGRLPENIEKGLLPSIKAQGTYRGRLYSVGTYDSGLGLYVRKSRLAAVGARIPKTPQEAWTVDEFDAILERLSMEDPDGQVLDLKLNYTGEYFTYAFSPVLWSAGAALIDRDDYESAQGVLNGPAAVSAMERVQPWFEKGLVDPNIDDAAFTGGRVSISWVGHWEYKRYHDAWGDDLAIVPLPDFGRGTRTGQGSWNWGITRFCQDPGRAARFLSFLLEPSEVLAMCRANGAVPATGEALTRSRLYGEGGPLRLFAVQLETGVSLPRPRTPAYPVISSVFANAFLDIKNGADVESVLDRAACAIDRNIALNRGYPAANRRSGEAQ